ncbi:hypothetical protein BHE74_00013990 [Ensete ventricosum]|nr:hypothetical protein BHE74_00013990 [Ensete ventricosum]
MGCICSKGIIPDGDGETHRTKSLKRFVTISKKEEVVAAIADVSINGNLSKPQDDAVTSLPSPAAAGEKKAAGGSERARNGGGQQQRLPTADAGANRDDLEAADAPTEAEAFSGEHAVAGWPSWLTAVAGDAVNGWQPRRAGSFEKLDKLEGIVASQKSCNLYLVFEYMEHDLAGLAAKPGVKFTEPQVKCYMQQLLEGIVHCHSRGVLHRDIKGSNLLIDDNGILKIADFGLATLFNPEQKQPLTSRVVTLWYRPPELLLGATEYGVAVDLWSSGCILAELLAGKPIMPGRTEVEQLHKIFKLCGSPPDEYWKKLKLPDATIFKPQHQYKRCVAETFKDFPSSALTLLDPLLSIEPAHRGTAASALESEVRTTHTGFYHSGTRNVNQEELSIPGRSYSSVRVSNGPQLQTQRSYMHQSGAANFSGSVAPRSTANSRYNRHDVTEPSDKHTLDGPASVHKKDGRIVTKDSTVVCS